MKPIGILKPSNVEGFFVVADHKKTTEADDFLLVFPQHSHNHGKEGHEHAGPSPQAHVALRFDDSELRLEVTDDGRGAAGTGRHAAATGQGLVGMRERVALYGGTLTAGPRPGGGFEVLACIPVEAPA